MKIAYLDCFSGISGDMFLGALVDAGVPLELLQSTVRELNLGAELQATRVDRNGISATKVDVFVHGEKDMPREEYLEQHAHQHPHEHTHEDTHAREHKHGDGEHEHKHEHTHRGLKEIRAILHAAKVSEKARATALRAFQLLGEAEAKIHNKDVETIHFHEVGSVDAIVDILCGAVAADYLGVDEWVCSQLNVGGGVVQCAHGTLPVPAPATLELLKDAPVYSSGIQKELVTPTGAAMVRALVTKFGSMPRMKVSAIGYGAGARSFAGAANVLRVTVGESLEMALAAPQENVTVIEANLDDMSPQVFGYVIDRLLAAGALDAFGVPVQMKKSRPGIILTVLTQPENAQTIAGIIFAETTTIGLRIRQELRHTLQREHVSVATQWGEIRIKIARLNGKITNFAPEFEDCRQIAERTQTPLKTIMQEALRLYQQEARE